MIYPKIPLAQSIIEICQAKGVRHIVIAPGSRNAPLTIGFVSNPFFTCYSIADERCAAFFALGMAQQLRKPVVVLCTSGSAVLNFYPAVAEAFYSMVPLIIISADRPSGKIDIGDGQTIRQENVMGNHTLYNANLTEGHSETNDEQINNAFNCAMEHKGPVHINAPFEEPLYETVTKLEVDAMILPLIKKSTRLTTVSYTRASMLWNAVAKKMVLVGTLEPHALEPEIIEYLANDPSVLVMTETTSNLHHPNFLNTIDTIITPFTEEDFKAFQPDILLTFGGMIVSKRIKSFLRNYKPRHHWHVDRHRAYDTFGSLSVHFKEGIADFFRDFIPHMLPVVSGYQKMGLQIKEVRAKKHVHYMDSAPFSDGKAFEIILQRLPKGIQLQVANSSAVRYTQLFAIDPSISVFCNRGTSGIDGSTSTAVGAAVASGMETVLITGDISFFYDSNALWNNYIPKNFKIILINNGGGGIFRILPGHQETEVFTTYFETSHKLTGAALAAMYGLEYHTAHDEATLTEKMSHFFAASGQPQLLEVFTPAQINDVVLKNYFKAMG